MANRAWFITGISNGFGRIMTEKLLEQGDRVAGTSRNPDELSTLKAKYGDQLSLAKLDLADSVAVHRVVDEAFARFGKVEFIVNNAGYALVGAVEELTAEQIVQQININVIGSIEVVRAALPHLRKQGGGRILQYSSMGGQIALPALSLYHASKWAIEGFFESTIQDIQSFNIEVTLIEPGSTRTKFGENRVLSAPLDVYADTAAGIFRTRAANYSGTQPGDPDKMVDIILASVDQHPAPKRLVLGSDAYRYIHAALTERLAELEAQKEVALSTDYPSTSV